MQKTVNQPWVIAAVPIVLAGFGWFIRLEVSRSDNDKALTRLEGRMVTMESTMNGTLGQPGVLTQLRLILDAQQETNKRLDAILQARAIK